MHTEAPTPLYLQLADRIEEMISHGMFRPGDRIPSVRTTSTQHQVSVSTVLQAYTLLEDRRLIEARPKSGYYVRSPHTAYASTLQTPAVSRRIPPAKSLSRFAPLMELVHDVVNPDFVRMGGAHPSPEVLPGRKLSRLMASLARQQNFSTISCDPAPGCQRFRTELSRRSLDWGCYLPPDDFVVTNGATEALYLALSAVAKPGETVIIESPTHYGVLNIMSQLGLKALAVPASPREGLDLQATRTVLQRQRVSAIVVVPNFCNPLGSCMPEVNRAALVQMAAEHEVPIIEDDVYGDLHFEGERPRCLKALDRTGSVLLCGSFSKTLAPGYRVGYISAGNFQDRVIQTKTAMNFCNAPLMALTVAEFLRNGGYEHHLRSLRRTFREQLILMREALAQAMPQRVKITDPQGGFVLWVELPQQVDALALFHEARKRHISIAPGHLFCPAGEYRHHMRISCGHLWSDRVGEAVKTLGQLVHAAL